MSDSIIYLKAEQCTVVTNKRVLVGDVIKLYGTNKKLVQELNRELLMNVYLEKRGKYIVSILEIMEALNKRHPELEWNNCGEQDFIIEYIPPHKSLYVLELLKTVFVCFIVFFGAAFTIMTFNQDVAVAEVFRMLEEMVLGKGRDSGILEITYSIGLPIGVIVFFNHFSKAKLGSDPTPLQVQMRVYEEDVNKAIIENYSRTKGKENE